MRKIIIETLKIMEIKAEKMLYDSDAWLMPFKDAIDARKARIEEARDRISVGGSLSHGVNNHMYYGLHKTEDGGWVFRE